MPLDELIRNAVEEAAAQRSFPVERDFFKRLLAAKHDGKEEKRDG